MKTNSILITAIAALIVGCANNREKTVLIKSTVLGIRVDPYNGGPGLRVGLVREQYLAAPVGAVVKSHVDAKVGAMTQTAIEDIEIGSAPLTRSAQTNAPVGLLRATNAPYSASVTNVVTVKAK